MVIALSGAAVLDQPKEFGHCDVPEFRVHLSVSPHSLCVCLCTYSWGTPSHCYSVGFGAVLHQLGLGIRCAWRQWHCLAEKNPTSVGWRHVCQVAGANECTVIRSRERFPSAWDSSANRFCFIKLSGGGDIAHIRDFQMRGLGSTAGCWVAPEHGKLSCNPLCSTGCRWAHQSACTLCCCWAGCSPCQENP